jgi:hypothetical protein
MKLVLRAGGKKASFLPSDLRFNDRHLHAGHER